MLRGRCSCAIPTRPTPSPAFQLPLTPLFPLLPGNPSVTSLFPLLTQKQGRGGAFSFASSASFTSFSSFSLSPNPFLFSRRRYYILNYMYNNIVGAPTYCKWLTTGASTPKCGPPQKDGPYTHWGTIYRAPTGDVNWERALRERAFYRGIIKYVGAPTYAPCTEQRPNPRTGLKTGHYIGEPRSTGRNACATTTGRLSGALYVAAARDRLGARSGVKTENPGSLLRRRSCCHVRYF